MRDWFTVESIDKDTFAISEYGHWEETHCYLLRGNNHCLLIDTGLGVADISSVVRTLTDLPVLAVPTHVHWHHIGGLSFFPDVATAFSQLKQEGLLMHGSGTHIFSDFQIQL